MSDIRVACVCVCLVLWFLVVFCYRLRVQFEIVERSQRVAVWESSAML